MYFYAVMDNGAVGTTRILEESVHDNESETSSIHPGLLSQEILDGQHDPPI